MTANISLNAAAVQPAYLLSDRSDAVPEWLQDALERARIAWDEAYPVPGGAWQVERYGRAGTLKRELETAGFVVVDAIDDWMDEKRYCYATFRARGE